MIRRILQIVNVDRARRIVVSMVVVGALGAWSASSRGQTLPIVVAPTDEAEATIAAAKRAEEAAAFGGASFGDFPIEDKPPIVAPHAIAQTGPAPVGAAASSAGGDELWFVSSRTARIDEQGQVVGMRYWKYDGDGHWLSASLEALQTADAAIPTCFHVHGNRVSMFEANCGGWNFYTAFVGGNVERTPLRWVIFSWPSDRVDTGPRKDVQIKAVRAECYGYYLAWLIDKMPADARLSVVGYSFGTRVIGSGLHYLGGGTLRGRTMPEHSVERRAIRAVLMAAAVDNTSFMPGHSMQQAPTQLDQLLIARNELDPALKWYALLYEIRLFPRRGQQAIGHAGVAGLNCIPDLADRVEYRDMTCAVGRHHDTHGYRFLTPGFVERMRQYVYFEELSEAKH